MQAARPDPEDDRRCGGDREAGRERDLDPAPAERQDDGGRPVLRSAPEDVGAQAGGGSAGGAAYARAAAVSVNAATSSRHAGARAQVQLELLPLLRVECIERVRGAQLVELLGSHSHSIASSPSSSRSRRRPLNVRLLIVPSGCPIRSAISLWLNPP